MGALLGEYLEETEGTELRPERELPIGEIRPNPFQPRREFDEAGLAELAESIRQNGLLQPIVVRRQADAWHIVAGERRWRALRLLGWERAPVVQRELSDAQMLVIALVENLQREDLTPLDEAEGFNRLMGEFGLTQKQVADQVGRSRSAVANSIRLLGLPEAIRKLLGAGDLTAGHARAILVLDDERARIMLAREIVDLGLSVREAERRARDGRAPEKGRAGARRGAGGSETDPVIKRATRLLERSLGTQVTVRAGRGARGEIRVRFHDADDFARILGLMIGERAAPVLDPR